MSALGALYEVHDGIVHIPVRRREVARVVVSRSHVTLEFTSLDDPLTSTLDLFAIDSVELGRPDGTRHPALGTDGATLTGLLGRRVTSCIGTPDGHLELRLTGSASVRASDWSVGFGDGRHWVPHVDGRIAEWRPGDGKTQVPRSRRRASRRQHQLATTRPLPLAGQSLQTIEFYDQWLGLQFEVDVEAQPIRSIERPPDIEVEFTGKLALGPHGHILDVGVPLSVAPLLALVGVATTGGTANPDGTLEIRFADGTVLTAGPGVGNAWAVTSADLGGWYMAKDGSTRTSKPSAVRPLDDAGRSDLVRAYLEYSATSRPDLFWVTERFRDLIAHAPEDAYEVVRELVREAPSPYVLSIVAAGPLEDLLSDWGERLIDRLETDARDDPKLMAACAGVWKLYMPDDVWDRLRRLVTSASDG